MLIFKEAPYNKFLGKIKIPMDLDLRQTRISLTNQDWSYKYRLKSVIFHAGASRNQGHYTSNFLDSVPVKYFEII